MGNILITGCPHSGDDAGMLRQIIAGACVESPHLLHVLHILQQKFLHVSETAIREVATMLALPYSQVEAVVEFYSFFHKTPRGKYDILFSNCICCGYLADRTDLMAMFGRRLGIVAGRTREDGLVSMDQTSCIGMCDHGAALLVNGMPVTGLDGSLLERIAILIEDRVPLADWPSEWFQIEDSIRMSGMLLDHEMPRGDSLRAMLALGAEASLNEIIQSGLRGRGGAGFSTGMKWKSCRAAQGAAHYVICNADEGEPGTFKDRVLLHRYADSLFEGMTVCAYLIGANLGYLYLRGEYRYLLPHLQSVLLLRRETGLLGTNICNQPGFSFDVQIVVGAGAYICGEESALIESLEGKRGIPRVRPPFPVSHGYLGQPTVVNNVETFVAAACVVQKGSAWFRAMGDEVSKGSKILSISGDCASPGIYEYPFGVSIRQVLKDCGAADTHAVQVGGPSGVLIGSPEFDRRLGYDDLPTGGAVMIFDKSRDLMTVLVNFSGFFSHESCGFCTPCRVGTVLLRDRLDKIFSGRGAQTDLEEMLHIARLMKQHSHCGLGQTAANPVLDGLQRFPQVLGKFLLNRDFEPDLDLDKALAEGRRIRKGNDAIACADRGGQ